MPETLRHLIARHGAGAREIAGRDARLRLADFAGRSPFGAARARFVGRSVALAVADMVAAAAALIDLDGLARRILLCPPGWDAAQIARAAALTEADALAHDEGAPAPFQAEIAAPVRLPPQPYNQTPAPRLTTEWVLPTSGTSGPPKLAVHTLATLLGAVEPAPLQEWATFYDIRRYGGLQILLRALAGRGSLQLSAAGEPLDSFLARLDGVTHISGTPTHWRKALMSGAAERISPQYVRLSGEIADDGVLAGVAAAFPDARVEHAYASTEAGVVFAVADVRAGFPAQWLGRRGEIETKLVDGSLFVRSPRRALRLIGADAPLADADGFLDTGDMIATRGERCFFLGRRGGIINVGGAKAHPEEIEAALNALAPVRAARVFARPSPITGALVAAEIVLNDPAAASRELEREIIAAARATLPAHMAPARIRFVADLPISEAGKLSRHG